MLKKVASLAVVLGLAAPAFAAKTDSSKDSKAKSAMTHSSKHKAKKKVAQATPATSEVKSQTSAPAAKAP